MKLKKLLEEVIKKGNSFCVVHGHKKKKVSKTDKPKGSVIACHPTKEKAIKQHIAIKLSKLKRKKNKKLEEK